MSKVGTAPAPTNLLAIRRYEEHEKAASNATDVASQRELRCNNCNIRCSLHVVCHNVLSRVYNTKR
jgi:hypothetical protein